MSRRSKRFRNQAANVKHSPKPKAASDDNVPLHRPEPSLPEIKWLDRPEIEAMKEDKRK